MRRLPVVAHLSAEEIDRRYRGCTNAAEKTRWHVVWLVTRPEQPLSATAAGKLVGYTPAWGRAILKRYNTHGPAALTDGRRGNGAAPALTPDQQAQLFAALQVEPPDGGLWSGPKVAAFVNDRFGVDVWPQTGWRWLKSLGFRLVVPRPRHPKAATPEQQRVWRDGLAARLADLRRDHPDKEVELWCEDEARLGLKPVTRRVWARKGTRPTSNGRHRFESVFVYGFAHPRSGRVRFSIRAKASAECMGQALADFAGWADPDGRKVLVVIVDGSGGHTAKGLKVPPGVVLHRQPSCTPELQPAEHLWPLVREGLANRVFDGLPILTETLARRCAWLADHPEVVGGAVGFHWAVAA